MPALPANYITQVKSILTKLCMTEADRTSLLLETFAIRGRYVLADIDFGGNANVFTVKCIDTLLGVDCFEDGTQPLAALLETVKANRGAEAEQAIDALIALANSKCVEGAPVAMGPVDRQAVAGDTALQSGDTDRELRTPTVFVSYAREDAAHAKTLIHALQTGGHACWIDTTTLKGGTEWLSAISEGINNSYAVVALCSKAAMDSRWVQDELLWARKKNKRIVPLLLEDVSDDNRFILLNGLQPIHWLRGQDARGLERLLRDLPAPLHITPERAPALAQLLATPRALELEYLDRLRFEELLNTEKYTPLTGTVQAHRDRRTVLPVVARPEFEHTAWHQLEDGFATPERFDNALEKLLQIRRAALLGEPGAGKTTTLWALASRLVNAAIADPAAPIPLVVRLGRWTDAKQPLLAFIATQLGDLGTQLPELLRSRRAALLLDGLNEVPVDQREAKALQVQTFVKLHPTLIELVSCRRNDYSRDLQLDRVEIAPLTPMQIREFVQRYLGETRGDAMFWQLAGDAALQAVFATWRRVGATFEQFWSLQNVPKEKPKVHAITSAANDDLWRKHVHNPASLMRLAANPYMLFMLTQVFDARGSLPANRGELFAEFVNLLLIRERLAVRDPRSGELVLNSLAAGLPDQLAAMAFAMQQQKASAGRTGDADSSAVTALKLLAARKYLSDSQLYVAASASLIQTGDEVRFAHQLLQEYFAARHMLGQINDGKLRASALWPAKQWWLRTGWEETCVLLAGLHSNDCSAVIQWLAEAQPEAAAQCVARSGAHVPDATLLDLRTRWLARLSGSKSDPAPEARAAIGRALGQLRLSNRALLDDRPGVGVKNGTPDIDWVIIPGGPFLFGDKKERIPMTGFRIARYAVTHAQFQTFIDDREHGFANPRWWQGLAADAAHRAASGEQEFPFWNHPRERVSWWDAMAFCRWLSSKLGHEVTLPTEHQWERAARFTDGREYPWGNGYVHSNANIDDSPTQYLQQTSAVGIFDAGKSEEGVQDLSGNVWEWCLNENENINTTAARGTNVRTLRGGSWFSAQFNARAAYRFRLDPGDRGYDIGFRVVVVRAPVTRRTETLASAL